MKYAAAIVAAAVGANAMAYSAPANTTGVEYVTEVVTAYETYCPGPTTITHGTNTYTVTEETTLTITDCPCTITKPVITTSEVVCHDCPAPTEEPAHPTYAPPPPPPAHNETVPMPTQPGETMVPTPAPTAGAAKVAGLSGLIAFIGLAAAL